MIDFDTIEKALHRWFSAELRIALDRDVPVIWTNQKRPRQEYPYGTLGFISGPTNEGGIDEKITETDLSQPAGEEVSITTRGPRALTLSTQCFGRPDRFNEALRAMTIVQTSVRKLSNVAAFAAAFFAVIDTGAVVNLTGVVADAFLPRAQLDVFIRTTDEAVEREGYINTVEISSPELGIDEEIFGG